MNLHIEEDGEAKCAAFVELQSPTCLEPPPEMIFDDSIFILVILTQLLKILLNLTCPSIFSLELSLLINSSEMFHEAYKKRRSFFFHLLLKVIQHSVMSKLAIQICALPFSTVGYPAPWSTVPTTGVITDGLGIHHHQTEVRGR